MARLLLARDQLVVRQHQYVFDDFRVHIAAGVFYIYIIHLRSKRENLVILVISCFILHRRYAVRHVRDMDESLEGSRQYNWVVFAIQLVGCLYYVPEPVRVDVQVLLVIRFYNWLSVELLLNVVCVEVCLLNLAVLKAEI